MAREQWACGVCGHDVWFTHSVNLKECSECTGGTCHERPRKPLGPMQPHEFEQDPEKTWNACKYCGLDSKNPVHKEGAGPL